MPTRQTKKKKAAPKQRVRSTKGTAGLAAFNFLNDIINFSGSPSAPAGDDVNTEAMPPFVVGLTILMALVIIGFIVYVGAILLGRSMA